MASRNGPGSGDGKRKWPGEGCGQEFPGDPPTGAMVSLDPTFFGVITENPSFLGVRLRVTVEIKSWTGKGGRDFFVDVREPKNVEWRKAVAAIIHDLARMFRDPTHPETNLNIRIVELWVRKQDLPEEDLPNERYIGKGLLDNFVLKNRTNLPSEEWAGLGKKEFAALKEKIAKWGLDFWKILKEEITKEHSRGGRLREEEDQIPPAVEENELPSKDLEKDFQLQIASLKATHAAEIASLKATHAAEITSLKETKAKDDATITSLMLMLLLEDSRSRHDEC